MATSATKKATRTSGAAPGSRFAARNGMGNRSAGSKLASTVADRLIADIAKRSWPTGEIIGSESELLERYGVSRAVFREAVRLLEHLHVARMRRGPGGGLVVMAPTVDSVTDAVSVYLYYVGAEVDEVFDARLALEEVAAELAPDRLDEGEIAALRDLVDREAAGKVRDHRELHNRVATATDNPALAFFVDLLNRATLLYLPSGASMPKETLRQSAHAHGAIVEAVLAGDGSRARRRMRKHLLAEAEYLRSRRPNRKRLADLPEVVGRTDKLGEQTAHAILDEVVKDGWPVGQLLGSEADLMARFDVSRAVLREAVRVLEHHQVARMRRGPGGGLFVAEPGVEAVTEAVAVQVDRLGIKPVHLLEVRSAVEMAVLDLVLDTIDEAGEARLREALAAEHEATTAEFAVMGHDLHGVLAAVSGNRVLELLTLVLVRLARIHSSAPVGRPASDPLPTGDVMRVHSRIVEAILARDHELARHRMRRHLDALVAWSR